MTNKELKKILEWTENRNFTWADLQNQFGYDTQKMVTVQNTLRSNMPATNNLVDHRYVSGENPDLLAITTNGRRILAELKNQETSLWKFFHNPWIVGIGLLIFSSVIGYVSFRTQPDIEKFAQAYQASYKSNNDFLVAVIATNVQENPTMAQFGDIYSEILGSLKFPVSNSNRLNLAKKAISLREELDKYLVESDVEETIASQALLELNTSATRIDKTELQKNALEITDLSQMYFDTVRKYKLAIQAKSSLQKDLIQTIITEEGGTNGFIAFLSRKENQAKIAEQNDYLEKTDFAKLDTDLQQLFARFKGAANLK